MYPNGVRDLPRTKTEKARNRRGLAKPRPRMVCLLQEGLRKVDRTAAIAEGDLQLVRPSTGANRCAQTGRKRARDQRRVFDEFAGAGADASAHRLRATSRATSRLLRGPSAYLGRRPPTEYFGLGGRLRGALPLNAGCHGSHPCERLLKLDLQADHVPAIKPLADKDHRPVRARLPTSRSFCAWRPRSSARALPK